MKFINIKLSVCKYWPKYAILIEPEIDIKIRQNDQ